MTNTNSLPLGEKARPVPRYELRGRHGHAGDDRYEIWQVPCSATPHLKRAITIGALSGRNLELVQHRVLRTLAEERIRLVESARERRFSYALPERLAVRLGLMFRALAPMRSRDNIWSVAEGIEAMEGEEAAYWLGMATHRQHPRRVLAGLRLLLTDPPPTSGGRDDVARADAVARRPHLRHVPAG